MTQNNDQSKKASAIFDVLEAKMNNAKFNAETSQKDLDKANTELEKMLMLLDAKHNQIKVLTENRDLNQRKYDLMLSKKHETIAVADALENLGADCAEVAIAIYRQGKPTPPTPTPPPTETEPQPQPEPQPEPIAAESETEPIGAPLPGSLPGATASEQIANIPPVKKPEAPTEPTSQPSPTEAAADKTPWRADGCILLPMDSTAIKLTQKIDGYTVSFKEAKDFKVSGKQHTSVTLKILGEGTGSNGTEVNCSFKEKEEFFVIAVKLADGSQSNDKTSTKRAEMPKWLKPLRRAAIQWMTSNFPYTGSKWEDEVNYVTPAPQTTDKHPSNAAAEPVK